MFPLIRMLLVIGLAASIAGEPLAAAAPRKVIGQWSLTEDMIGDEPNCLLLGWAAQDTMLMASTDAARYRNGKITLTFMNVAWSIKKGDDVGEITFETENLAMSGVPVAGDKGFFLELEAEAADTFFADSIQSGFQMTRDGEVIGRYVSGNLPSALGRLSDCGARLYSKDPFAR